MKIALASVALFLGSAVAACGGSDNSTIDSTQSDTPAVSCGGATIAATVTVTMNGLNFAFSPMNPTVHVGDIVEFNTTSTHPVSSGSPAGTPDGKFNTNGDGCVKFTKAGSYPFYCSVHLFSGTVTVQ